MHPSGPHPLAYSYRRAVTRSPPARPLQFTRLVLFTTVSTVNATPACARRGPRHPTSPPRTSTPLALRRATAASSNDAAMLELRAWACIIQTSLVCHHTQLEAVDIVGGAATAKLVVAALI